MADPDYADRIIIRVDEYEDVPLPQNFRGSWQLSVEFGSWFDRRELFDDMQTRLNTRFDAYTIEERYGVFHWGAAGGGLEIVIVVAAAAGGMKAAYDVLVDVARRLRADSAYEGIGDVAIDDAGVAAESASQHLASVLRVERDGVAVVRSERDGGEWSVTLRVDGSTYAVDVDAAGRSSRVELVRDVSS